MNDFGELRKSLSAYIDKYPAPTKEENAEWLLKLSKLDKENPEYAKVRERMILSNGAFAMRYVMRYQSILNDDVSIMDLFQEATLGVIEAIDTFDIKMGTSFTTYAYFHIRKRIIDFIKKNKLVRAPRDIARNLKHVNDVRSQLLTELKREPIIDEIVKRLRKDKGIILKPEMVDNIVILLELNSAGQSDSFINEFREQVAVEDQGSDIFRLMEAWIESKLRNCSEQAKKMIRLRFGIGCDSPHTLEEVNYMLNISKEDQKVIKLTPESDKHFFI